jgi:D-arabinose 1-dehydrogenase-like Zn-dependent alcohol dehydrogenase
VRAVVYSGYRAAPELIEVADPACPANGVVIAVGATGVCRSDWHAWQGHDPVALPHIGGHEFAGVVAATGPEVTGGKPGTGSRFRSPAAAAGVRARRPWPRTRCAACASADGTSRSACCRRDPCRCRWTWSSRARSDR